MDSTDDNRTSVLWSFRDWRGTLEATEGATDAATLAIRSHVQAWCGWSPEALVTAEAAVAAARDGEERDHALAYLARACVDTDRERATVLADALEERVPPLLRIQTTWARARRALAEGRFDASLAHMDTCEALAVALGEDAMCIEVWLQRAFALAGAERAQEGLHWAEKAVEAVSTPGWEALSCRAARVLEQMRTRHDLGSTSLERWRRIVSDCEQHGPPSEALSAHSNFATTLALLKRYGEALQAAESATRAAERLDPARVGEYLLAEAWVHAVAKRTGKLGHLGRALQALPEPLPGWVRAGRVLELHDRVAAVLPADFGEVLVAAMEPTLSLRDHPVQLPWFLDYLAERLEAEGHVAEAIRASAYALRCLPLQSYAVGCRERLHRLKLPGASIPVGPYLLRRRLGRGGMGEVWDAGDVAVKWVMLEGAHADAARARFQAEVAAVAARAHTHVVPVHDTGTLGEAASILTGLPADTPWLAMAKASHSLQDELPTMTWPRVHAVVVAVLDALSAAHAQGRLHLDVKPDNVLLNGADIWLADFGLAAAVGTSRHGAGTPQFMAPERFRRGTLGVGSDLYAVGCMVWQLVTGSVPFDGDLLTIRKAHVNESLPTFCARFEVPPALLGWLAWLLEKEVEDRPASAGLAALSLPGPDAFRAAPGHAATSRISPAQIVTLQLDELTAGEADLAPAPAQADVSPLQPTKSTLRPWREVCRCDVPIAQTGPNLLHVRSATHFGHEPLKDSLWAHLERVHASGRSRILELVSDGDGASDLASWLCDAAGRSGVVGVAQQLSIDGRFPTTLLVLPDAPSQPAAVRRLGRLLRARLPVLGILTRRRDAGSPTYATSLSGLDVVEVQVPSLEPGAVAQQLQSLLPLDDRVATSLAERVGGDAGWARAALLGWHRGGQLVRGLRGYRLREGRAPEMEPLPPPEHRIALDALDTEGLQGLQLLALADGPVPHASWAEALTHLGLPGPEEVVGTWWPRGLVRRQADAWHIPSAARGEALRASARARREERASLEAWVRVWHGSDPVREALARLALGHPEEAFPVLLGEARRRALDQEHTRAGELVPALREGAEMRGAARDGTERVAIELLELVLGEADLEVLARHLPRVDAHGDPHDRAWLRLELAERLFATERAAALRRYDEAAALEGGGAPALFGQHMAALLTGPGFEQAYTEVEAAWQAADRPDRAVFVGALRAERLGDREGAARRFRQVARMNAPPGLTATAWAFLGSFAEQEGAQQVARQHYEASVRAAGDSGRDGPALLGLALLALGEGQLWGVDAAKRLRPRFEHVGPQHLLTIALVGLTNDPVDVAEVQELAQHARFHPGYLETLEVVKQVRERLGRDVTCLEPARAALLARRQAT